MKRATLIFLLLAIAILPSCKKEEALNTFTLGIDVQSSFDGDVVQVVIDGQEVINKQLQTNYVLGVCYEDGQITTTANEGSHEIKVVVNNAVTEIETFTMSNDLYIGIGFNPQTNDITFVYANERFLYD